MTGEQDSSVVPSVFSTLSGPPSNVLFERRRIASSQIETTMSHTEKPDPELDALIENEVNEALRPYEGDNAYPPEVLEDLRRMMRIVMRTHPTATHLLEQLRPRAVPDQSGKEDVRSFHGVALRGKKAQGE